LGVPEEVQKFNYSVQGGIDDRLRRSGKQFGFNRQGVFWGVDAIHLAEA
jgi:hypothetical protein